MTTIDAAIDEFGGAQHSLSTSYATVGPSTRQVQRLDAARTQLREAIAAEVARATAVLREENERTTDEALVAYTLEWALNRIWHQRADGLVIDGGPNPVLPTHAAPEVSSAILASLASPPPEDET